MFEAVTPMTARDNFLLALGGLLTSIAFAAWLGACQSVWGWGPQWLLGVSVFITAVMLWLVVALACDWHFFTLGVRRAHRLLFLILLGMVLTVFIIHGTTPFSRHDEIYSWNLWAIQHWQRVPHDLSYTQAPYPQLFSYWLSSFYGAQNNAVNQWLPRLASAVPSLVLASTFFAVWRDTRPAWRGWAGALLVLYLLVETWPTLRLGYADPLMAAALAVSFLYLLRYDAVPAQMGWLWASVAAACMAAMTKQPGTLWLGCLLVSGVWQASKRRWPWRAVWPPGLGGAFVVGWLWLSMPDIANNHGVVAAAFGERSVLATLWQSVQRYFLQNPVFLLLCILGACFFRRSPVLPILALTGFLPMTLLWFTLGSYEHRHGMHILWLMGLALCSVWSFRARGRTSAQIPAQMSESMSVSIPANAQVKLEQAHAWPQARPMQPTRVASAMALACFGVVAAVIFFLSYVKGKSLADGQQRAFTLQMAQSGGSDFYSAAIKNQSRVWVSSNYSYGLFYGRLPLGRPQLGSTPNTPEGVKNSLLNFEADYAISSGRYAFGDWSRILDLLVQHCPNAFSHEISSHDGIFNVYRVQVAQLRTCSLKGLP